MHTAAIEQREKVCELDNGEGADAQFVVVKRGQLDAIESNARPSQVVSANDQAGQQLLV